MPADPTAPPKAHDATLPQADESRSALPTPSIRRRLAAFLYEGVLLFGVVMIAGLVYSIATQQRHALEGQLGMRVFLFAVFGLYFVWFWTHGGQTVAMQAWHVRLVSADGQALRWPRALLRYLLSWLWFVPAAGVAYLSGLRGGPALYGALFVGVLAYAALAWLRPDRQFWHDVVSGTRLVHWRAKPPQKPQAASAATP